MNAAVLTQTLKSGRIGLVWYALATVMAVSSGGLGLSAITTQGAALQGILQGLPPAVLEAFKINLASFTTPIGYISARALSLIWPLVIVAFAAGSAGGVAALIERGTVHFELSLPVSRTRWLLARILAGLIGVVLLCTVTLGMLFVFASAAWVNFIVLGAAFAVMTLGVAYAVAAFARDRGTVTGAVFGLFAMQFLLETLSTVSPDAAWLRNLTVWSAYIPERTVLSGVDWGVVAAWLGIGVLGFGVALWQWNRRDLPA